MGAQDTRRVVKRKGLKPLTIERKWGWLDTENLLIKIYYTALNNNS
jgi:hypothetical protein